MYRTRRPRRTRFTATLQRAGIGVTQKVILAYTPEAVAEFYARRGWVVLSVVKGDFVNTRPAPSGGWKLSSNLADAKDFLGLTLPVQIKQTGHQGGRYGAYSLRIDRATGKPYHHITVKSWLSVAEAGRTLWHELCHAMQAERAAAKVAANLPTAAGIGIPLADLSPATWLAAWRTTDERAGSYRVRAIEVEARSFEPFNDEQPLAVAR